MLSRIPKEAQYIAWVDADVQFANRRWAAEAIQKLGNCDLVQLFEDSDFLGANGQPQFRAKSLMYYAVHQLKGIKALNERP